MVTGNITSNMLCDDVCWTDAIIKVNAAMATTNAPTIAFMTLMMVIGIPGNVLVIIVYSAVRLRSITTTLFVEVLACLDLTCCVAIHPYVISKLVNTYMEYNTQNVVVCKLFEYLIHSTLAVSVLVLLLFAVDRYLAICRPYQFIKYQDHSGAILITVFTFGVLGCIPILDFFGMKTVNVTVTGVGDIEGFMCDFSDGSQQNTMLTMCFGSITFLIFVSIVCAVMVLYFNVARTAYRRQRRVSARSDVLSAMARGTRISSKNCALPHIHSQPSGSNTNGFTRAPKMMKTSDIVEVQETAFTKMNIKNSRSVATLSRLGFDKSEQTKSVTAINNTKTNDKDQSQEQCDERNRYASNMKATKILFLVTAVFLLSWLPFWVFRLRWVFAPMHTAEQPYPGMVAIFFAHLFYLNNAANPVVYTIINRKFRQECRVVYAKFRRYMGEFFAT